MTIDPQVLPGLMLLATEFLALAAIGFVVVRVALRQRDARMALAQGMVVGPAVWGLTANFVLYLFPGLAGALASWIVTLAISAGLAWRARQTLRMSSRVLVVFGMVTLALFWVALSSRQMIVTPDVETHRGLAATLRAGAYPPTFPWVPDVPAAYHHGVALLVALLSPPFGPDLAFVTEFLSAYVWTGFVLVVATSLLRYGGRVSALTLTPLLLSQGLTTLVWLTEAPVILQVPVPAGIPEAGLRASLTDIFWPSVSLPWMRDLDVSPPNVWKPLFVLAYALAFVALERMAASAGWSWLKALTLAVLLGFLGLLDEIVALMTLALWILLEFGSLLRSGRDGLRRWDLVWRAAAGPALAGLLLAAGGGVLTDVLIGSSSSSPSLGWIEDAGSRRPFGLFEERPGGVGLLGVGPLLAAAAALLLARHQRLVLALVAGSVAFLFGAFVIQYELAPHDVTRIDGYARNFALLALLIALASRLPAARPRWRYTVSAFAVALIVWPTVALPVRNIALGLSRGPQFANARPEQRESTVWNRGIMGRYDLRALASERVAAYIRDHTAIDARILSPSPHIMSVATGRPNASGYTGFLHYHPQDGPQYEEAIRFLEPAAVRRRGFAYVHATDAWVASLPNRAMRWLEDPGLFELLVRDGADALYRIRPAFLELETAPTPESFEALRQAIPASAVVYLGTLSSFDGVRLGAVLPHARLLGEVDLPGGIHLRTDVPTAPLGKQTPDYVVMPTRLAPSALHSDAREPIWTGDELAAYAASSAIASGRDPSPQPATQFAVRLSDVREADVRIRFTVTYVNHVPDQWTGQDWLVSVADDSPYALLTELEEDGYTHVGRQWFAGQIGAEAGVTSRTYEFDALAGTLAVGTADDFVTVPASGAGLTAGVYVLTVRLRQNYLEAAVIPVMRIVIAEAGGVTYMVYEGDLGVSPDACPERLKDADSCRQLAANAKNAVSS